MGCIGTILERPVHAYADGAFAKRRTTIMKFFATTTFRAARLFARTSASSIPLSTFGFF